MEVKGKSGMKPGRRERLCEYLRLVAPFLVPLGVRRATRIPSLASPCSSPHSCSLNNQQGVALLEFVIILPMALIIMLGLYEGYNLVALHNNLNEISTKVASWVGQQTSQTNINDCFIGAWLIGQNYDFALKGSIVVTGVASVGSQHKMAWQLSSGNFAGSKLNTNSSGFIVNPPFNLAPNQNLIIVEVQYPYVPFFSYLAPIFPTMNLYKIAQAVPQQSNFSSLPVS